MSDLIPLCPPIPDLLNKLQGKKVVLRVDGAGSIEAAVALAAQYATHLHCLVVKIKGPLEALDLDRPYEGAPIALLAPGFGRMRHVAPKLRMLKQMNVRIYLPLDRAENFAGLRILSSLGCASAAIFQDGPHDWEQVSDLMTYALMNRAPRAPIDPFNYLAERYHANRRNDFAAVYFDDPARYVHVDASGRIALTAQELADGVFIADDLHELEALPQKEAYIDRMESWRHFFLKPDGCAYCEAWRICLGKFSPAPDEGKGCAGFFKEFLETVELYQSLKVEKVGMWQP